MPRSLTVCATAAATTTLLLAVRPARADAPECPAGPNRVLLHVEGLAPDLEAELGRQLHAALAERKLSLCAREAETAGTEPTLAGIDVGVQDRGPEDIVVTVTVRDDLTAKRVSRDVSLRGVPPDARALVLAQATDELLRASWAELLVKDAPPPARPVPVAVRAALPTPPPAEASPGAAPVVDAGATLAGELFGSGQRQLGADVVVLVYPMDRIGVLFRAGARIVERSRSRSNEIAVDGSALVGTAGIAFAPLAGPPRRFGVALGPALVVTQSSYEAKTADGRSDDAAAVHAAAFGRGWVTIAGPLRAALGLEVGAPLHTVRVVVNGESVTGVGGVLAGVDLALGGAW